MTQLTHHRSAARRPLLHLLAACICLALLIAPAAGLAQSAAATVSYADPDGRFALAIPSDFTESGDVTYEMAGEGPLDGLLASTGRGFRQPDANNSVAALFLLLDKPITDQAEFTTFLTDFQAAAGGEVLPLVEWEVLPAGDNAALLRAGGSAATCERSLRMEIQAEGDVVAILSAGVERSRRAELSDALDEVFAAFTWSPQLLRDSLLSAVQEPAQPAPVPAEGDAASETLAGERYQDPDGVFSLVVPADFTMQPSEDEETGGYLSGFFAPGNEDVPTVAAGFLSARHVLDQAGEEQAFGALSDEEWTRFVEQYVRQNPSLPVVEENLNDRLHTAYFLLRPAEEIEGVSRLWMWLEEADGVVAYLLAMDVTENVAGEDVFHTALTTFDWSPPAAQAAIARQLQWSDPATAPVPFQDPLGLIGLNALPAYPFQSVAFDADTLDYSFGTNPAEGIVLVSLSDTGEGAFTAAQWEEVATGVEETLVGTLADSGLGRNPALLPREMDVLDAGEDNTAADNAVLLRAASDLYQMAVVLLDYNGILVTQVFILPDVYWQESETRVRQAIAAGVDLDGATVRDALQSYADLGATLLATTMSGDRPGPAQEPEPLYAFAPDAQPALAVHFAEPDLDGELKAVIFQDGAPDHPVAAFALDLADGAADSYDTVALQDDTGTRVAFIHVPDYAMTAGSYTGYLYYNDVAVAAHRFVVQDAPPAQTELANFGVYYGDAFDGAPILSARAIHAQDTVIVRGTGDLPPDSRLRLFWYDPDGLLALEEIPTIRIESSSHSLSDWFYFDPQIDWQPGNYTYVLTLNGEPLAADTLRVVEASADFDLSEDGAEVFAALPLPDLEIAPAPEGVDLAIVPSEEFNQADIISTVDAWLRGQGWQPVLPTAGGPIAWQARRWTKDGYQLQMQSGAEGREGEVWMSYAPISEATFGWLPAGDALAPDTLDRLAEVAAFSLADTDAAEAVLSPDGNWLAVTTTDGRLFFFDAHRLMDALWWSPASSGYAHPTFSPDSRDLAVTVQSAGRAQIQLFHNFDVVWLPTTLLAGQRGAVTGLAFQPDGLLAAGDAAGGLRWWDVNGAVLPQMDTAAGPVTSLAPSPAQAPGLLFGLEGGTVDFRLANGEPAWSDLGAITTSPQLAVWPQLDDGGVGDLVVYGQDQAEWYAYDVEGADLVGDLPADNPDFTATGAAFSPDGRLLIVAGSYAAFYDRVSGEALGTRDSWSAEEALNQITDLSISDDGVFAVLVTSDGRVRLWAAAAQ